LATNRNSATEVVLAAGELADSARDLCVPEGAGAHSLAARDTGSDEELARRYAGVDGQPFRAEAAVSSRQSSSSIPQARRRLHGVLELLAEQKNRC
jgi:hypothetical protein